MMDKYQQTLKHFTKNTSCYHHRECPWCEYEECKTIIDTLNKASKYRWHYLKDNPNDLPEENKRIIFNTIEFSIEDTDTYANEKRYWSGSYEFGKFYNDDYEGCVTKNHYSKDKVIAWKYMEVVEDE